MNTDFYIIVREQEQSINAVNRLKNVGATVTQYPNQTLSVKGSTRYRVTFNSNTETYFSIVKEMRLINQEVADLWRSISEKVTL